MGIRPVNFMKAYFLRLMYPSGHQDFDFCGFRIPESRIRSVSATRRTPQRYHPNDYPKNQGNLCRFCEAIQASSPVDAHVTPVPSHLPGYQDEVIMAAGTFVQGASIELSADAPVREPLRYTFKGA